MKIEMPVLNVKLIDINKVKANDYNPNAVAPPEMELLKKSIEEDGYTMPIVTYYDSEQDMYVIVDGFHRYRCAKEYFNLEKIPISIIDKPIQDRMASTIRHNRARGVHAIKGMSNIVLDLFEKGWSDIKIAEELGMEMDEVVRLKQITGIKQAFANHEFSKSWEEFESRFDKK